MSARRQTDARDENARDEILVPVRIPSPEHCTACTLRLKEAVDALPGVGSVRIDPASSTLTVVPETDAVSSAELVASIERLGQEVALTVGHAVFRVTGLDCPDCARTVDKSVGYIDGVLSASLNFASGMLYVEYEASRDPRQEVVDLVRRMEYGIEAPEDTAGRPIAEFEIEGIDCPDCAASLRDRVAGLAGVGDAALDFGSTRMRVGYDPTFTSPARLAAEIGATGYRVRLIESAETYQAAPPSWIESHRQDISVVASGLLIVLGWALSGIARVPADLAFVVSAAVGGGLIARRAVASLRARVLDMNVLMTIAVIGACALGDFAEAAMVVFLYSVGGSLESRSLARTRRSIGALIELAPPTAHVVTGEGAVDLGVSEVGLGDTIVVRAGERIPLDCVVVEGVSAVDESPITGESLPVEKRRDDALFAGSLNTQGVLRARVTALAGDSTLARVIELVEQAQAQQAPFQRLVDRFTRRYTPVVVVLAAFIAVVPPSVSVLGGADPAVFADWVYRALVLLVVSCPCALVISTPVAVVSAITRATRDGVLVKGGAFLEMAPKIRAVALDKTGTLTFGRPEIAEVVAVGDVDVAEAVRLAASLERESNHPLAAAVLRAVQERSGLSVATAITEIPGSGLLGDVDGVGYAIGSAAFVGEIAELVPSVADEIARLESDGHTTLVLAERSAAVLAILGISDEMRPEASSVVARLREQGVEHVVMLTGDNERTAAAVASRAGLSEFRARLLPDGKTDAIGELQDRYGMVAMVGDGINDAPALARADLGIAMAAAGSDTAIETADVALMANDLLGVPAFFALGSRTSANVRQNVGFSVAVKLLVLVAAVAGYAPLWLAVFADTGVALLVILNGLRLLGRAR